MTTCELILTGLVVLFVAAIFTMVNELKSLKERIRLLKTQLDLVYKMSYDSRSTLLEMESGGRILDEARAIKSDILEAEKFWSEHLETVEKRVIRMEKRLEDDVK